MPSEYICVSIYYKIETLWTLKLTFHYFLHETSVLIFCIYYTTGVSNYDMFMHILQILIYIPFKR